MALQCMERVLQSECILQSAASFGDQCLSQNFGRQSCNDRTLGDGEDRLVVGAWPGVPTLQVCEERFMQRLACQAAANQHPHSAPKCSPGHLTLAFVWRPSKLMIDWLRIGGMSACYLVTVLTRSYPCLGNECPYT